MMSPNGKGDEDDYDDEEKMNNKNTSTATSTLINNNIKQGGNGDEIPFCGCMSLSFYQPYFDVDTNDIITRVINALFYCKRETNFLTLIETKPDAYGPFWIATTLSFTIAVTSHISSWLKSWISSTNWEYDFQSVVTACSFVFSFASLCPILIYFIFKQYDSKVKLISMICLYGYSLFVFIPATLLCLIPSVLVQWLVLLMAGAASGLFLLRNLAPMIVTYASMHAKYLLIGLG